MSPLDLVLARTHELARRGRRPVAVFDLDSTLFDTAERNLWLMRRWAGDGPRAPLVAEIAASELGWDATEPLRRRGVEGPELQAFRALWAEHFFTDEAVLQDAPSPGAAAYVGAVHAAGAHIVYLTGRHVGGMEVGTATALTRHRFPMWTSRVSVHLKPSFHLEDARFKAMAVAEIGGLGEVVATFDNEPANGRVFATAWPDAVHVLFGSVRSAGAEAPVEALIPVATFER